MFRNRNSPIWDRLSLWELGFENDETINPSVKILLKLIYAYVLNFALVESIRQGFHFIFFAFSFLYKIQFIRPL